MQRGWIFRVFSADFKFTKRQLGQTLLVSGLVLMIAILAVDVLNAGREGGIGPAQCVALMLCGGLSIVGLSLIPLGNDPA